MKRGNTFFWLVELRKRCCGPLCMGHRVISAVLSRGYDGLEPSFCLITNRSQSSQERVLWFVGKTSENSLQSILKAREPCGSQRHWYDGMRITAYFSKESREGLPKGALLDKCQPSKTSIMLPAPCTEWRLILLEHLESHFPPQQHNRATQ